MRNVGAQPIKKMRNKIVAVFTVIVFSTGVSFATEPCEVYVDVTTSCGEPAVASGCTVGEIIDDALAWDELLCDGNLAP